MTLRIKTLLAGVFTLAGLIAVLYLVAARLLLGGFAAVEDREATKNMQRTAHAIDSVLHRLDDALLGWSQWDDSYKFIHTDDPKLRQEFLKESLGDEPLAQSKSDVIIYIRNSGHIVFGTGFDRRAGKKVPLPADMRKHLASGSTLLRHDNAESSHRGILLLHQGPLLLVSRPVVTNAGKGPIYGSLIWGRFLDDSQEKELSKLVELPLTAERWDDSRLPSDFKAARLALTRNISKPYVHALDENTIAGYIAVKDFYGKPALLVRSSMPRDIYQQGQGSVRFLLLSVLGVGLIFGLLALGSLELWILSPLGRLSRSVQQITAGGDVSDRVPAQGHDELSQLARSVNSLLEAGGQAQQGLRAEVVERRRGEEEVQRSRQELQGFIDAMSTLAAKVAPDGTFLIVNKTAFDASGLSREEYMKTNFLEGPWWTFDPDVQARVRDMFRKALAGTRINYEENVFVFGQVRTINFSLIPMRDAEGKVEYLIAEGRDITELKQTEMALQQAKEEAERANLAKSEFLSRMSHELRTPLNAILGFGQVLNTRQLQPREMECVGHIVKGGHHLLELINEVLDIARVEAGHISLSIEPVAVAGVLRETLDLMVPLAVQQGIQLLTNAAQSCQEYVQADRQRLKQVLINVLANAVKYNRPGGEVMVTCVPDGPDRMRIQIKDNGPGIAPADLQRLFIPFDRLGAEKSSVEGTGLGLTLSRHLVQAMDGVLEVESAMGQGSTFSIVLPIVEAPTSQLAAAGLNQIEPDTGAVSVKTRTVLAIEDNPSNLTLLEMILEGRPDVTLIGATQGSIGLELARQHRPDLILLDLHLPDIQGDEILRRLRADETTRDIPVIMLSADATPGQIDRLLKAGAMTYLTKPLNVKEFLLVMDECLKANDEM
jgi:PAS domain S-box-containing protein